MCRSRHKKLMLGGGEDSIIHVHERAATSTHNTLLEQLREQRLWVSQMGHQQKVIGMAMVNLRAT
jgi:hypothetical protein